MRLELTSAVVDSWSRLLHALLQSHVNTCRANNPERKRDEITKHAARRLFHKKILSDSPRGRNSFACTLLSIGIVVPVTLESYLKGKLALQKWRPVGARLPHEASWIALSPLALSLGRLFGHASRCLIPLRAGFLLSDWRNQRIKRTFVRCRAIRAIDL